MTVPARRPEDQRYMDALDRLEDALEGSVYRSECDCAECVGFRDVLSALRKHSLMAESAESYFRRALAAEDELQRLREERDALLNWRRSMSASPSGGGGAVAHRLDNAQAAASEAAAAWCWEATPKTEEALRNAVAEWRTAVGLWKLAMQQDGGGAK